MRSARRRRPILTALAGATAIGLAVIASLVSGGGARPVGAVQGAVGYPASAQPSARRTPAPSQARPARPSPTILATRTSTPATPPPTPAPTPALPEALRGYQWPLPHGRLTLPFGPTAWGSRIVAGQPFHDGMDLATFCGDRIVAAHAGTVLAAGRHYDELMGWVGDLGPYLARLTAKDLFKTLPIIVVIDDGNGYRSIYAHLQKVDVKPGQVVRAGQSLGLEGATGRASGCHLHYGLFSPLETSTFAIDPALIKRMKLPPLEIARVDPSLVLPARRPIPPSPAPSPTSAP